MNVAICFGYNLRKSNMHNKPFDKNLVWSQILGICSVGVGHDCQVKKKNERRKLYFTKNLLRLFNKQ